MKTQQATAGGRVLHIALPPSYDQSDARYPVAYVQDGGDLASGCFNYLDHLYAQGLLRECILVGIETDSRNDDYTPWPAEALVPDRPSFAGRGRDYANELADVIKPYMDADYRTLPEPEHTAVIGASLGGLISLFAGCWRPDAFGRLGLLSTSFWYEGVMAWLREKPALSERQRVYMSIGTCEGIYKRNAQRDMVRLNREVRDLWLEQGFPAERLQFETVEGGTHDLLFMLPKFPEALKWLFEDGAADSSNAAMRRADRSDTVGNGIESAGSSIGSKRSGIETVKRGSESEGSGIEAVKRGVETAGCGIESADRGMETPEHAFVIPRTWQWDMRAARTGRDYRIFVSEPVTPPPEGGYPVLYALDGNASFGSLAEAMRLQSRPPHGIEPMLVIGIGYDSNAPIVTEQRFFDYTERAEPSELPQRPGGSAWPTTGGTDDFLAFIEEELKPAIERRYPVDRRRQSLFGHSLGGLFALYALFTRPESFRCYVAGSPSIWWKNHALLQRRHGLRERLSQGDVRADVLIGIGSEEKPSMISDARGMHEILQSYSDGGLSVSYREFEREGHVSVIPPLISCMFRWLAGKEE